MCTEIEEKEMHRWESCQNVSILARRIHQLFRKKQESKNLANEKSIPWICMETELNTTQLKTR